MMRSLIRRILRRLGLVIITTKHSAARYVEYVPRSVFDDILMRSFPSLKGLCFIQVGANDGMRTDPIRQHVIRHGWTGCLVEPIPQYFQQLRKNYHAAKGLRFLNAALGPEVGRREIFHLRPGLSNLPDWAWGLASFSRDRVVTAARELKLDEQSIISELVDVITWDDLTRVGEVKRCDVLVIDTEGQDLPLLRSAPLAELTPRVIHFEHACAEGADRLAIYAELLEQGYEISTEGGDTIAHRAIHRFPASAATKD